MQASHQEEDDQTRNNRRTIHVA